jgi:hypothetical protein
MEHERRPPKEHQHSQSAAVRASAGRTNPRPSQEVRFRSDNSRSHFPIRGTCAVATREDEMLH